jgi:hypothetical protein
MRLKHFSHSLFFLSSLLDFFVIAVSSYHSYLFNIHLLMLSQQYIRRGKKKHAKYVKCHMKLHAICHWQSDDKSLNVFFLFIYFLFLIFCLFLHSPLSEKSHRTKIKVENWYVIEFHDRTEDVYMCVGIEFILSFRLSLLLRCFFIYIRKTPR